MYTNDLLEEKYKAQKELFLQAEKQGKEYHQFIREMVQKLFKAKGWTLKYSPRKGGFIDPNSYR